MSQPEIHCLADASQVALEAAREWVSRLANRPPEENFTIALSGGRIAGAFFEALVQESHQNNVDWTGVHVFWSDERCVDPQSPESNYREASAKLLVPLGLPGDCVHLLAGDLPEAEALERACQDLGKHCRTNELGTPMLDLIFLGMGEDGHTASLFPEESAATRQAPDWVRAVTAVKPPPRRLTMGYPILITAEEVHFLVPGAAKEPVLRQALDGLGSLPAGEVMSNRSKRTVIWTDIPGLG